MSSMRNKAIFTAFLLSIPAGGSAAQPVKVTYSPLPAPSAASGLPVPDVATSLGEWRALRASGPVPFARSARFLVANPGWPGEEAMRSAAERAMAPVETPSLVIAFFAKDPPTSGRGWARLAEARAATGDAAGALAAARSALSSGSLSNEDEAALIARFGGQFTTADYDRRADALLFAGRASDVAHLGGSLSPARRAVFDARVALQQRAADADARYQAVRAGALGDAGLLLDRSRYLRATGRAAEARALLAQQRSLAAPPADPARFIDAMETAIAEAQAAGDHGQVFNIARQTGDLFAPGTDIAAQSYAVRDALTTINWRGGLAALDRLGRPRDAMTLFARYAESGRSLQVASKGFYWAGRAATAAGDPVEASRWFALSAASPEVFYGQLALERLGRAVPAPPAANLSAITPTERSFFFRNRLVQALRSSLAFGSRTEQSLFVRALAESLETDKARDMGIELSRSLARPDLAVWIARSARNMGAHYYVAQSYPVSSVTPSSDSQWAMTQAITRQESSFDPAARSRVGATGLMQLMPDTAREQAAKLGLAYDEARLTDPSLNVQLGNAYYKRLLANWGDSHVLAVASYNAGPGNAARWLRGNGDPRGGVDAVRWIEAISFEETRGYVQRVIENGVVYRAMSSSGPRGPVHVSLLLGKSGRPG